MKNYNQPESDWERPASLYLLDINGMTKFGITSDWQSRLKHYQKEIGTLNFKVLKKVEFEKRWQAELIEQIMKWRLRPWSYDNRHEWINAPLQLVWNCYLDSRERIMPEIDKFEYIHKRGNDRWGYYKQIVDMQFDDD